MNVSATSLSAVQRQPHWLDAVADPVRLQILRRLSEIGEATASELAAHSPASDQTLRRHLGALQASGVIQVRRGASDGVAAGRPAARFSVPAAVRESVRSTVR